MKPESGRGRIAMRASQMRRGFGNACLNVVALNALSRVANRSLSCASGSSCERFSESPVAQFDEWDRRVRLPTMLAHFQQFILTAKYKGFCNVVIHELQVAIVIPDNAAW